MYCSKCGAQVPNEAKYCPDCGTDVSHLSTAQPNSNQQAQWTQVPQGFAGKPKKQGKKHKTILIVSACVVVLACAILIPVLGAREAQYKEAIAMMDSGKAPQAKEGFIELGDYKESAALSLSCQNMMDFEAAKAQMDAGEYAEAKKAFEKLGDYGQAAAMVTECDYNAAVALMEANKNKEARTIFLKLGEFKDSAELANECNRRLDYDAAKSFMDRENYAEAIKVFTALGDYSDAAKLAEECQNRMDYTVAITAYNQGKYYTAYVIFKSLGGYTDSVARANDCIQANPKNGEVYRNEAYSSKKCPLTISTADDGYSNYLKFYTESNDLVATVFIASGQKARIKLPVGTYKIKSANGIDWFGTEEMFGDEGNYQLLTFGSDVTTSFKSSYTYTLALRSATDGNVGSQTESRESF